MTSPGDIERHEQARNDLGPRSHVATSGGASRFSQSTSVLVHVYYLPNPHQWPSYRGVKLRDMRLLQQ